MSANGGAAKGGSFPRAADLDHVFAILGLGGHSAVRDTQLLLHHCGGGRTLPVCMIEFDAAAFTPDMFTTFDVESTERMATSVPRRQAEFFFGRMAARAAMLLQGFPAREVVIGPHRQPLWPLGLTGSISHTTNWAAASVVADYDVSGVGIDVEAIARDQSSEALRDMVFDARELAYLAALPFPHDLETRLTLGFSAKEAFFKGAFGAVGRYFDFSAAQVCDVNQSDRTLELMLEEQLCDDFRIGQRCSLGWRLFRESMLLTGFAW